MVTFSHLDPGTAEAVWTRAFEQHRLPAVREDFERLVVVAAHPDDESLGAAGIIARSVARGVRVEVVVVTDGDGSHPASPTHTPAILAERRRAEVLAAMSRISDAIDVRFLGHLDGATDEAREPIARALREILSASHRRALVLAPWQGDGHRDHRVVGEVVADLCAQLGIRSRQYPIWLWHWGGADDVPWTDLEVLDVDGEVRAVKRAANDEHRTQVHPLSDAAGDEVVLHAGMREHFARSFETFVVSARDVDSMPQTFFDAFYDRNPDPWGFDSRWYEERKRDVLLAALPRRHYAASLELGCATGALTARLADRSDRVLAVDFAESALRRAAGRLSGRDNVDLRRATLPADWPAGRFDLIVLSEVGYYWDAADLGLAVRSMISSLAADGHIVACHWRHPVAEYPRSGDAVHAVLRTESDLIRLVSHEEEDFVLEVYGRPTARSVAAEAGLVS